MIEQRGPLQWRAKVRRGGVNVSRTFIKRSDAERWARETEVAIQRGVFKDLRSNDIPFEDVAARYLREVTPSKRSGDREAYRIATLIAAPEFKRHIGSIDATHVAQYRDRRLATEVRPDLRRRAGSTVRTLSGQTVLHELNTLSAIWQHARTEWSLPLPESPVRAIRKPRPAEARSRRLGAEEITFILRACEQVTGLKEAVVLALETSMRLSELLRLTWDNVNLDMGTAHLPATKNGHPRDIALSPAALAALTALKPELSKPPTDNVADHADSVAVASHRNALEAARRQRRVFHWAASDSFDKTWRRALRRARGLYEEAYATTGRKTDPGFLDNLRWHDLRHEAVSRLFERGLNAFEVASMSGHRSMQMLARYTHVPAAQLARKLAATRDGDA